MCWAIALLCCIFLFTARVVYALLLLLLLFLLFMFVELSTDVFVLFVCLFVLFHSVDHHILLGQAVY